MLRMTATMTTTTSPRTSARSGCGCARACEIVDCSAGCWPLRCAARAYAARPDQAGVVAAIDQLFAPIALLAPLAIGALADQFGIVTALTALLLEPLGVLLIALVVERSAPP